METRKILIDKAIEWNERIVWKIIVCNRARAWTNHIRKSLIGVRWFKERIWKWVCHKKYLKWSLIKCGERDSWVTVTIEQSIPWKSSKRLWLTAKKVRKKERSKQKGANLFPNYTLNRKIRTRDTNWKSNLRWY